MGYASETGYVPSTIDELMDAVRVNINAQFSTTYITENFVGTNFYKYFYSLIQELQKTEVKAGEIFLKMQEYFAVTNESIVRPNTTHPGIYDYFAAHGYLVSTKAPIDADAGKAYICVNTDSGAAGYAATKLAICKLVKDCVVAGVVSQGTEVSTIALDNGQSFDFKFNLPNKIPVIIRVTIAQSANNLFKIDDTTVTRQKVFDNITAKYRLGKNFEPQRYFSILDAPWAATTLLEWSSDAGSNWHSTVYSAAYNDLFTFALTDITIVET